MAEPSFQPRRRLVRLRHLTVAAAVALPLVVSVYAWHAADGAAEAARAAALEQATGRPGASGAQLSDPSGVAVDAQGNLYVADTGNHRVVKLAPSGRLLAEWRVGSAEASAPSGVAVDGDGNVYVADWQAGQVFKLAPTGLLLAQWGAPGNGPGAFDGPRALTLDADGNVYVADTGNQRIQKLAPSGEAVFEWGAAPNAAPPTTAAAREPGAAQPPGASESEAPPGGQPPEAR